MERKINIFRVVSVCLLCAVLLIGCGNNESASSDEENGAFPLSIMINFHTPEVPDEKVLNLVEEATNTDVEIQWVPDNTYSERLQSAFATSSLPDVVFMKSDSFMQFKEGIRDGQFWEVGPYLDQFENLSKLNEEVLKNTMVDGKLYSLYQARPLSRQGMIYRKDWADALGLDAPKNTDEFYDMLKAFTEEDPDGNGAKDTIGLTDRNDVIYGAFDTIASWFGAPNNWGEQDGQLLPDFMSPEYMDTLTFFRDLHSNGYINQDFPVTSKSDQQELFKNGTAGVYVGSMGDVQGLYEDAKALNPEVVLDVHNQVKGPDGEFQVWSIPGYNKVILFPKSAVESEEELLKILGFLDELMNPELSNLLQWGIEGEHYKVTDGKAEAIASPQVLDTEVSAYKMIEVGGPESNGRYEGYFSYEPQTKAEELYKDNAEHLVTDPTVRLESPTYVERGERLDQIMLDATYKFIIGQLDEAGYEKAIEEWKEEGGDQIIEEYNASNEG